MKTLGDQIRSQIWRSRILFSALAFGAGMTLGFLFTFLILISPIVSGIVDLLAPAQPLIQILLGVFLFLGAVGLGGAVAGALGGWALSRFSNATTAGRFLWRGALSFFLAQVLMAVPAIAVLAVVAFLNPDIDFSRSKLPLTLMYIGLIYGGIAGLIFGLLTAGLRRTLGVMVAAIVGFAVGGLLLGFTLRIIAGWDTGLWRLLGLLGGFFFFGAPGGATLAVAYMQIQDERRILADSRIKHLVRAGLALVIGAFVAIIISNLFTLGTVYTPDLDEQLVLPTVGTHWLAENEAPPGNATVATRVAEIRCLNNKINVTEAGEVKVKEGWTPCYADPLVAEAADGRSHAIWYSDEIQHALGGLTPGHFLLESILADDGWTEPAIVVEASTKVEPMLLRGGDQTLYLTWNEDGESYSFSMTPYSCDEPPAGNISQEVFEVVRQELYRHPEDPVAFCDNRFDRLHYTPNPTAPEIPFESTPLGAFDTTADLVRDAKYEVLFVTMQWDAPSEHDGPGDSLAQAIAELYRQVQTNPEQYPRGMTVRIMLGNLPETAVFSFAGQLHHVITDLKKAGVEVGQDPNVGWKVELANYTGSLPHAHSKFMVVDGKTAVVSGFNYSYLHLEDLHPHQQALGMTDMGIQMTGPVVQTVMAAYDDLWRNSERVICPGNPPSAAFLFRFFCTTEATDDSHVPEVLRFYPTEENVNSAFALHHTVAHLEADEALLAAIRAADEKIDLYQVNFSLNTPCLVLSMVSDLCNNEDFAPLYMLALRDAILENDIQLRVMMEESAMNGMENRDGIRWLQNQLEGTGKEDNLDLRFSAIKMHNKAVLVDDEFLAVGSQNFHWSAWGSPSLTEYTLATDDPKAVAEFLSEFRYWWDLAIPVKGIMRQEELLASDAVN